MARKQVRKTQTQDAIGYIRVSTADQQLGMNVQQERIESYCKMMGFTLVATLIEEDVSGKTRISERPEGSKIAALLASGASHVVALKLDRLFRNAADALNQCDGWQSAGVAMHLVDMGGTSINTATAMGKMMLTMLSGFAEWERNCIVDRTASALQHLKASGRVYNHTPFGKLRTDDGLLVDHEAEQAVIQRMRVLRDQDKSFQGIADDLNAGGIPSKAAPSGIPKQSERR